jgi:hypothetical protein
MPVAEEVGSDGGVAVPAFVGVLGPVACPWRVVRKVSAEMKGMQQGKAADEEQPEDVEPALMRYRQRLFLRENGAPRRGGSEDFQASIRATGMRYAWEKMLRV